LGATALNKGYCSVHRFLSDCLVEENSGRSSIGTLAAIDSTMRLCPAVRQHLAAKLSQEAERDHPFES